MSDDSDLSTTTSSGSESETESEEAEVKKPGDDGIALSGSAREEFRKITAATDAKNAAIQREGSSPSKLGRDNSSHSVALGADESDGADAKRDTGESKNDGSSDSGSDSDSDLSAASNQGGDAVDGARAVSGQHHDEEMELEMSADTVDTTVYNQQTGKPGGSAKLSGSNLAPASGSSESDSSSSDDDMSAPNQSRDDMPTNEYEGYDKRSTGKPGNAEPGSGGKANARAKSATKDSDDSSSSSDDSDDSDSDSSEPKQKGKGKGRKNYNNLNVSSSVQELFQYIGAYEPTEVELPTFLKPFVPDYIPSIGVPDVFVKMDRPDGKPDRLGLEVLDEPATQQTDKDIFAMQLRSSSKVRFRGDQEKAVPCIEHAEKKEAQVQQWIDSIGELHAGKPPTQMVYKHAMPDVDHSMQVWPEDFEKFLQEQGGMNFTAELDVDLQEFASICCALMDIPVHAGSLTESLHAFFTLWDEFRSNQHFQVAGGADPHVLEHTDYRLSTPEAIEAAMMQSDHRPTTADGIRQAMENSMADQRPSTSTHVKNITGNYRPDTAAAIEAVQKMEEMSTGK